MNKCIIASALITFMFSIFSFAANDCEKKLAPNSVSSLRLTSDRALTPTYNIKFSDSSVADKISVKKISGAEADKLIGSSPIKAGPALELDGHAIEFDFAVHKYIDSGSWTHSGESFTHYYVILRQLDKNIAVKIGQVRFEGKVEFFVVGNNQEQLILKVDNSEEYETSRRDWEIRYITDFI